MNKCEAAVGASVADEKNTRRRVALRLSVGGKAGSGFLSRAFVLCRLRICASLCGARFFFSFSRGLLGPKHVEVHEMRAEYVFVGFGEGLQGYAGSDQVSAARCRGFASLGESSLQINHDYELTKV